MLATVIVAGVLLGVVVVFLAMLCDLITELQKDFMEYWKDFEEFWDGFRMFERTIWDFPGPDDDDKLVGAGEDDDNEMA